MKSRGREIHVSTTRKLFGTSRLGTHTEYAATRRRRAIRHYRCLLRIWKDNNKFFFRLRITQCLPPIFSRGFLHVYLSTMGGKKNNKYGMFVPRICLFVRHVNDAHCRAKPIIYVSTNTHTHTRPTPLGWAVDFNKSVVWMHTYVCARNVRIKYRLGLFLNIVEKETPPRNFIIYKFLHLTFVHATESVSEQEVRI